MGSNLSILTTIQKVDILNVIAICTIKSSIDKIKNILKSYGDKITDRVIRSPGFLLAAIWFLGLAYNIRVKESIKLLVIVKYIIITFPFQ